MCNIPQYPGQKLGGGENASPLQQQILLVAAGLMLALMCGCGGAHAKAKNTDFFTSGSREADQRASQRMAKDEQLAGGGEGAGENGVRKATQPAAVNPGSSNSPTGRGDMTNEAAKAEGKLALYDRLGGEAGISNIVADFLPRALQDPRVNWQRIAVKRGGFSIHRDKSETWTNTPANIAVLQNHMVQFLALAAGGPAHYEGKEIQSTHADMHISNPEFDATIGDLKASLDRLQVPNKEQKELLAIVESTRPQIVTER